MLIEIHVYYNSKKSTQFRHNSRSTEKLEIGLKNSHEYGFTIGFFSKINTAIEETIRHTQATSLLTSAYRSMKTLYTINMGNTLLF